MAEIEQPTIDVQKMLDDLISREPDVIKVCGKNRKIHWLHNGTVRKFSHIMIKDKNPWRRNVKVCACVFLNRKYGFMTWLLLWSWHWIYWRWLYYIRDIDQVEVAKVLDCAKKKIQLDPLAMATILATGMMDTMMTMARHEYGPAERGGDRPTP